VGIDLGTTFSVIAIRTDEGTKVFRDKQGRALVPSGVYFGQDGSERDSRALLLYICLYPFCYVELHRVDY
jgi:molecular chaperone DnaK (HSP70)